MTTLFRRSVLLLNILKVTRLQRLPTMLSPARVVALALISSPLWAAGGGKLTATRAIAGLSAEVSGPLAYGALAHHGGRFSH
jgi:hypothetical protein